MIVDVDRPGGVAWKPKVDEPCLWIHGDEISLVSPLYVGRRQALVYHLKGDRDYGFLVRPDELYRAGGDRSDDDGTRPLGEIVADLKQKSCNDAMPYVLEAIYAIHKRLEEKQ